MYKFKKSILSVLALAIVSISATAQYNANSPYSRFGLGDPVDQNFMSVRMMGGIGSGFIDSYGINTVNPASYGFIDVTSFDMGVFAKYSEISDDNSSSNLWNGNLAYMSLAFPLTNPINEILDRVERKSSWGMNLSLIPQTSVGYNITSIDTLANIGAIERQYSGNGGTYKFQWGNAYRYKDLSVGLNMSYLFGKITYERNTSFLDIDASYDNLFLNDFAVSGFLMDLGVMYRLDLNKKQRELNKNTDAKVLAIGAHISSPGNFNTNGTVVEQNVLSSTTLGTFESDTLRYLEDNEGSGKLGASLGFGATYYAGNKYAIGMSYTRNAWSNYENDANPANLEDTYKVSFGGYVRPNYKSFTSYFKRVYYRWGLYYGTDPRIAEQDQITNYGASFGFGLPFIYQRKVSHANLGVEFGRRGKGSPIQESFATINFSFTFNDDEWFIKRKYD